jgi:hypothetical protein
MSGNIFRLSCCGEDMASSHGWIKKEPGAAEMGMENTVNYNVAHEA